MSAFHRYLRRPSGSLVLISSLCACAISATAATVEEALKLVPVQRDVEIDRPSAKEIETCTIESEQIGDASALVVRGQGGQVLRAFIDSNKDSNLDQWCYFLNGIESYRDVDSNFDGKPDQYRWLGLGGTKWAIDRNQDGRIDEWKTISAEELSFEVLAAIRDKDIQRFERLLITSKEIDSLGLSPDRKAEMTKNVSTATKRFAAAVKTQRSVDQRSKWVHFGATKPCILPAGSSGNSRDVYAYENVSAMIENGGKHGQIGIGALYRVGENWRLVDIPTGLMDEKARTEVGYVLTPAMNKLPEAPKFADDGVSEEMQEFMTKVDAIEKKIAAASPREQAALYDEQTALLRKMAGNAKSQKDQFLWIRQLADTLGTATQTGAYPKGLSKLQELYRELAKQSKESELTGYVKYRWMTTNYSMKLQEKDAKFEEIQENWLAQLEEFVDEFPNSPDASDAMLQLAIAEEYAGNEKKALGWYDGIIKQGGAKDLVAKKAQGARTRLTSVGRPIRLAGNTVQGKQLSIEQLRGRIVLVHYWATWCEPCKDDIRRIDKLVAQYGGKFMPVGVNLDTDKNKLAAYLKENRLSWPQLFDSAGLDGGLAVDLGVLTLPTMILLDEKGNVVNRDASTSDVDDYLDKHLARQAAKR
jgi:thiol-disulfide isomerase/thioredoxin